MICNAKPKLRTGKSRAVAETFTAYRLSHEVCAQLAAIITLWNFDNSLTAKADSHDELTNHRALLSQTGYQRFQNLCKVASKGEARSSGVLPLQK